MPIGRDAAANNIKNNGNLRVQSHKWVRYYQFGHMALSVIIKQMITPVFKSAYIDALHTHNYVAQRRGRQEPPLL